MKEQERMKKELESLVAQARALGPLEILMTPGANGENLTLRVPADLAKAVGELPGVQVEVLPDRPEPPLDMLLTINEAVELAHSLGYTKVRREYLVTDVCGRKGYSEGKHPRRNAKFEQGREVYIRGTAGDKVLAWLIDRRAFLRYLEKKYGSPGTKDA